MGETSNAVIAALTRLDGAPPALPVHVTFSALNPSVTVGRAESNNVVLVDKRVSKLHCRLTLRTCKQKGVDNGEVMKRVFVRDVSSFGTFLNGTAVQKEQWIILQEGDVLGLRNPHGNLHPGEYRIQYSFLQGLPEPVPVPSASTATVSAALNPGDPVAAGSTVQPAPAPLELNLRNAPSLAPPAAMPVAQPAVSPPAASVNEAPPSPLSECSEISAPDAPAAPAFPPPAPVQLPPFLGAGLPTLGLPTLGTFPSAGGLLPMPLLGAGMLQPGLMHPGLMLTPGQPMMMPMPTALPLATAPPAMPSLSSMIPNMRANEAKAAAAAADKAQAKAAPVAITVEEELVGKIIGRGGEIVKQLQRDSGARIDVSKVGSDTPEGKRIVYVSGTQNCIDKAKAMIEEALIKAKEVAAGSNPNVAVVNVSSELIGKLIGRGGELIKDLEKESGARIDIRREQGSADSPDERQVHITGPADCVGFAKKAIEDRLGGSRASFAVMDREERGAPKAVEDSKRSTQVTIQVEQDLTRLLIGKGGETINAIQKKCGVRLEIARGNDAERSNKRPVHITGSSDGIEKAKDMISETLSGSRERKRDRSPSVDRYRNRSRSRDRSPSRPLPQPGDERKVLSVAQEFVGILIGKGGETMVHLSKQTGARIEVTKDGNDSDRSVVLNGQPDAIAKATSMIEDIIAQERKKPRSRSRSRAPRSRSRDKGRGKHRSPPERRSPPRDSAYINEKVYVDECDMPYRPNYLPEHTDGLPTDLEIFIRGLPRALGERDLWEHLCRLGASDVKEILLLRRQKVSKGMAYVVFNRHDHAVMAKHKLHGVPASSIPVNGQPIPEERHPLMAHFSESERCISGRNCVYGTDMAGLLLGTKGKNMEYVKDVSGLRKVLLTGRSMRSFGEVDDDPRLHIVLYFEANEVEGVNKAIQAWGEQLGGIHREIIDKSGKGFGKGKMPMMPMPHHMHMPFPMPGHPPMPMPGHPPLPGHPPMPMPGMPALPGQPPMSGQPPVPQGQPPASGHLPAPTQQETAAATMEEASEENPVLMQRRQMVPSAEDPASLVLSGPKVVEATCLRGQELRWQPWPDVTQFNQDWAVTPMRWGLKGELFVLLRKRETGELRVCVADVRQSMEKWVVLSSPTPASKTTKHWSFTFKDHLFVIAIDRESGSLRVYHLPDPAAPWAMAFETTLAVEASNQSDGLGISRRCKLHVFYAPDKIPHIIAIDPKGDDGAPKVGASDAAKVFSIADPGKVWIPCRHAPAVSAKARVMSVYTKTQPGTVNDFDVALFAVDYEENQLSVHLMPGAADQPWILVTSLSMKGDSRLCCTYVPGKPEPVVMAGSPTERTLKLCHLNLLAWSTVKRENGTALPQVPVLEEKLSRQMGSIWPPQLRPDAGQTVVAMPIDCTADLPVSRHPWITKTKADVERDRAAAESSPAQSSQAPADAPAARPPDPGPDRPPGDQGGPPLGAATAGTAPAPGGALGVSPSYGMPQHPGFGRPPFDDGKGGCIPFGPMGKGYPPPMSGPMGKGFGPPPFGHPGFGPPGFPGGPPGAPPFGRPPMDPAFGRPPYGGPGDPMHFRPFEHGKGAPPPGWGAPGQGPPPGWGAPGQGPPGMPPGQALPPASGPLGAPPPAGPPIAFDSSPRAAGDPSQWQTGQLLEADFKASGQWQLAKIAAKIPNGTFDIEYRGDYMEFQVPPQRLRLVGVAGPLPSVQPAPAIADTNAAPNADKDRDRDRRRRRDDKDKDEDKDKDGEKKHRRRRHRHRDGDKDKDKDKDKKKDKGSDSS